MRAAAKQEEATVTPLRKLYTYEQAGELLGMTPDGVKHEVKRRHIGSIKLSDRKVRITEAQIREYIERGEIREPDTAA